MLEVLIGIVMLTIFIGLRLMIPRYLVGRAIKPVILRFRQHGALDAQTARSAKQLGLGTMNFAQRMIRPRDYGVKALEALIQTEIVTVTDEGLLYLSEERLAMTPMGQKLAETDKASGQLPESPD